MPKKKGGQLSLKEQRFVDAFLGPAAGNATEAAVQAGYGSTRKSAGVLAVRLLANVRIGRAIATRTLGEKRAAILTADERDQLLSEIARKPLNDAKTRIRAISELNKCTGRHSVKHLHEGKLTLEQAIGASRK